MNDKKEPIDVSIPQMIILITMMIYNPAILKGLERSSNISPAVSVIDLLLLVTSEKHALDTSTKDWVFAFLSYRY